MDSLSKSDPLVGIWVAIWSTISSYGLFLILSENKTASKFYVYGKSLESSKKKGLFWTLYLVPKKFFGHFYLTAIISFLSSLILFILYYLPSNFRPIFMANLESCINYTCKYVKIETHDSIDTITSLLFTIILMLVQSTRRLYESYFVSVYSSSSKINLIHYAFGHLFYVLAALSTICPILYSQTASQNTLVAILDNLVTKKRAALFVLFVYASHYQHKCHKILANLRKDKWGRVITEQHYVPTGGLFEYVTCPHFLIEIILYLLIVVIQDFNVFYWNLIFLLVLSTQTLNAITEHKWYKKSYKDYPKGRTAIVPKLL